MLRKVLHDHPYITRHSNQLVFRLHDIDPPYVVLWRSAERLKRSVTQRCLLLQPHDLVQQLRWGHLQDIQNMFLELHEAGPKHHPLVSLTEAPGFLQCRHCSFCATDVTVLRQHYATVHGFHMYRTQRPTPSEHMLHGLPQCKHCLASFTTWRQFVTHIECGCQVLCVHPGLGGPPGPTAQMPLLPTRLTNARSDEAMRGHTQIGVTELRNLMAHDWGPRLLRLIGTRQLHLLRQEAAITDYLAQRCCLCDQWVGRAQEMHKHLRLFHAAYWPMVMAKSTQLSNLHATESPCVFCKGIFQKSHSCNTWTQVSLLLIYGAAHPDTPDDYRGLQCEICDQVCQTQDELYAHLLQTHQLTSARWNQGRDSIDGGSGCAHCGQIFGNMESLRSHISQGRCSCFNPTLTSEPSAVTDRTIQVLCEGGLTDAVQDLQWRLHHTLRCLCCSATYQRASDLMLHLQSAHAQIWRESEPVTALLIGLFYRSWGCICNPSTTVKRLNHVCVPLKQMAMQFLRLPSYKILMPLIMTEHMLSQALPSTISGELRFALERALITRDLETLLAQRHLMKTMACTCLLCGQSHTAHELGLHLREAHDCSSALVSFYVQQLIPLMLLQNPFDHMCHLCDMIFNLPMHLQISDEDMETNLTDRIILAQSHFKAHCPVSLQLALVLCRSLNNGGHHHDRGTRGVGSDSSNLPAFGTFAGGQHGQGAAAGTQSGTAEATSKRRRTKGQKPPRETGGRPDPDQPSRDNAPHGQDSGPSRPTAGGGAPRGYIHLLLQQSGAHGITEVPDCGSGDMAHPEPEQTDALATAAATTATGAFEGPSCEADSTGRGPAGFTAGPGGHDEQGSAARSDLSLPGMGQSATEADSVAAATHLPEKDGSEHPGAPGDVHGGEPGSSLPCIATDRRDHSLAPATELEGRPGILADACPLRQQYLGPDGGQSQGPQPSPVDPGNAAEQEPQSENPQPAWVNRLYSRHRPHRHIASIWLSIRCLVVTL